MGCDKEMAVQVKEKEIFQSTHPYGVRQTDCKLRNKKDEISIHAPVWGATNYFNYVLIQSFISIHAPVWGATQI